MWRLALLASLSACSVLEYGATKPRPGAHPWGFVAADGVLGTGTLVGGVVMLATADPGTDHFIGLPRDFAQKAGGVALLVASAAYLGSAIYGAGLASSSDREAEQDARQRALDEEVRVRRERAWTITREAATAARGGDCGKVVELDGRVREVDADFHATVFRGDAAIARCLTAPVTP